jgi:hypothetical protein
MPPSDLIDPFHRALYGVLIEKIDARMVELARGGAGNYEEYCEQVGYLRAFNDVLDITRDIATQMYGSRQSQEDTEN